MKLFQKWLTEVFLKQWVVLIYILGVSAIKEFALPLIVGILAGAYTSIFIASTFWASWKESDMKAKAAAAQERKAAKKNK